MNSFVIVVLSLIAAAQANVVYRRLQVEDRIVGGEIAVPHSYPYQAFLLLIDANFDVLRCGGSLLTTTKILTAAHCLPGNIIFINVFVGAHDLTKNEATRQTRKVVGRTIHKDYNGQIHDNDIAILTLASPVELNEYVQLTTLPTRADVGNTYVGQLSTVSGWGKTSDVAVSLSPVLRFVSSPIVSNDDCSKDYGYIIPPTRICVDGKLVKVACNGDSGGPLVVGDNRVQVGIVSYVKTIGCEKGIDVVYTRVTAYLDWIATNGDVQIN